MDIVNKVFTSVIKTGLLRKQAFMFSKLFSEMAQQCFVVSKENIHQPILLEDGKLIKLGRSLLTKIKDSRCSREQLSFKANYANYEVELKQIAPNLSTAKGKLLAYNDNTILKHNDEFEFLSGKHNYEIQFIPAPKIGSPEELVDKKRTIENYDHKNVKFCKVDQETKDKWESINNGSLLVLNRSCLKPSPLIASYDMDGTLITTRSGRVFPKDNDDWKILYSEVPGKLKELVSERYKIVLFTNQAGIETGKQTVKGIQDKIERVLRKLGVDGQALVSTGKGSFRKPNPEMWNYFLKNCNGGVSVDMTKSFYIGDAAGRVEVSKERKKDHSCSDRLFALNIAMPFYTPEEHFLNSRPREYKMPNFDPRELKNSNLFEPEDTKVPKHKSEAILLIGYPGCGKSSFVQNHLRKYNYNHINRDQLGTWQKCVSQMENSLQASGKVVIDNTNPDIESRKRYIGVASKLNVPIRCFVFNVSLDQAKHNNKFRELSGSSHAKVSEMVYNTYKSKYQEPTLDEGFEDIVKVNFIPEFKDKQMEALYKQFLLEK